MEGYELIVVQPDNSTVQEECRWDLQNSRQLIDFYGKYREKVGSFKIRSLKQMWTILSEDMTLAYGMKINPNNCENRWRVLERNYKKYIENQNSTGRGRKYFDYSNEMDQIFAHKKNVHPEFLLTSDIVVDEPNQEKDIYSSPVESPSTASTSYENTVSSQKVENRSKKLKKQKITTIEKIRRDRLDYQEKKLKIENEKLEQLKIRNELIKARNVILASQCTCKCTSFVGCQNSGKD